VSPTRRVHAHVRTLQDECLHTFWLTKTCLCVTFNIWHHLFHLTTHICSRNDVPPHDFNLRTLLCVQLLTHETMSENIGFTDSKDSVHCKKACLYATLWLTWSCACATWCHMFNVTHRNYGTSCIQTRPLMRKFACGHVHVSQKVAQRDVFLQWIHITVIRVGQTNDLWHDFVCENLHLKTSS